MIWSYNPLIRNKGSSTFISINGLLCLGIGAKFNHQCLVRELSWIQSHYIKVTQEGVSNRTIQNWLWIEPYLRMVYYVLGAKKMKKIWFLKLILCIFSVQTLKHFQKKPKTWKKLSSKVAQNQPKQYCHSFQPLPKSRFLCHKKCLPAPLLYNDFAWICWHPTNDPWCSILFKLFKKYLSFHMVVKTRPSDERIHR